MFCPACGTKAQEEGTFCIQCGAKLPPRPVRPAPQMAMPPSAATHPTVKKGSHTGLIVALVIVGGLMLLGIISAITIPNLLAVKQKANVKNTRKDMSTITTALMDYLVDNAALPVQAGRIELGSEIIAKLSPFYIKMLPTKDAWGNDFLVYCGEACNGQYGLSGCRTDDFLVISLGKDRVTENWDYDPANPGVGLFSISGSKDYDKDLVMFNGDWIRAPFN